MGRNIRNRCRLTTTGGRLSGQGGRIEYRTEYVSTVSSWAGECVGAGARRGAGTPGDRDGKGRDPRPVADEPRGAQGGG